MNRMTLHFRKLKTSYQNFQRVYSPKIELFIDRYKLVKTSCVLGGAINCYFFYQGLLDVIVLNAVKNEVQEKKDLFYKRV